MTHAQPPAILARDVHRHYGADEARVAALDGVSLEVAPGTFTAIMGPSGSGKSTLLHCLAGLDAPDSGEIEIAGQRITGLGDSALTAFRRDRLGFVFQSFNLVPTLTAHENIVLPARLAGRAPDEAAVRRLAERLGLASRLTHRPGELSGGQQQRVAIARALLGSPDVIFADEPTGALDTATGDDVLALLRDCVDTDGRTVVMVTHDDRAAGVADRIVRMVDGRVAA
ncbi:ABC transporter ATP-binding protein [Falsarthrobacter nasiphocae]|uniref:ABC transport system ATP-binding protein n=1 Tax=Falsarthrobacter nasiphocae TaxID=189863 RepID=A0AAE4C601_9MICC|nr:ABC transporter ATP-binding protein [Falsarthrobacter nasiphocae]MDR6892821.1 putative ABC transport system ATP-binding protein [Falsarthrobacter nasiphocae]